MGGKGLDDIRDYFGGLTSCRVKRADKKIISSSGRPASAAAAAAANGWQRYEENMNMDDDEHDRYDDGRQKHIYVTTQERNGCHLNTESHRITNYSSGDAASQQAGDIAN